MNIFDEGILYKIIKYLKLTTVRFFYLYESKQRLREILSSISILINSSIL